MLIKGESGASWAMPVYFFHMRTPLARHDDDMGLELRDAEAAYLAAYDAIPEMAADLMHHGCDPREFVFVVEDQSGCELFEVPFTEAMGKRTHFPG